MSKITKKQFLADVEHEVRAIKANATPEEIEKLNFSRLNPLRPTNCIYGQMTGICNSKRAEELMNKSCIRQTVQTKYGVEDFEDKSFTEIKGLINGEYKKSTWEVSSGRTYSYLSALEAYICLKGAKNENIIKFLKGETETLEL